MIQPRPILGLYTDVGFGQDNTKRTFGSREKFLVTENFLRGIEQQHVWFTNPRAKDQIKSPFPRISQVRPHPIQDLHKIHTSANFGERPNIDTGPQRLVKSPTTHFSHLRFGKGEIPRWGPKMKFKKLQLHWNLTHHPLNLGHFLIICWVHRIT